MKDEVIKIDKWEFDEEVTSCFDDMLTRSIPDYDNMRSLVQKLGFGFVKIGKTIVDLGCSNGGAVAPYVEKFGPSARYLLLEKSEPMIKACKERFGYVDGRDFDVRNYDIVNGVPIKDEACLVLSVLTIQFTPIEYRQKILKSVYDSLEKGGAFIFVEKVLGSTFEMDEMLVSEYYKMKSDNMYTQEQIKSKRKSLEGVLVPVTAKWNEDMLKAAGFSQVECFWRYLNFAGWIAVK